MARTVRGKRLAFDNISYGNATGVENTIAGSSSGVQERYCAGSSVLATTAHYPENFNSVCGSSYTSPKGLERLWKTVSGGAVTDVTTDLNH